MLEGHEVGGDGVRGLGLTGVNVCPLGLRALASLEGGGRTPQRLRDVNGYVPPDNQLSAYLRGGYLMVAIRIYRGPSGCLFGACIHITHPVCGSGGECTLSGASNAPQETIS